MRSPVADLVNYVFSTTDAVSREAHMDEFLNTYYTNLAEVVRIFGSDPEELFSRENFEEELRRNSFFGLVNAALFLPSAVSNDAVDINSESETNDESVFVRLDDAAGAQMRKRYIEILDYADDHGWLDELRQLISSMDQKKI